MQVQKRNGTIVDFDIDKIKKAIQKAFMSCGNYNDTYDSISNEVKEKLDKELVSVPEIQEVIEKVLMQEKYYDVAKSYIEYRSERDRVRQGKDYLFDILQAMNAKSAREVNIMRENANINANSAMGLMLKYGSETAKILYKMNMPEEFAVAHNSGTIHVHDLDFYGFTTTCTQIDLDKLFKTGFNTGHGYIREPQSILSYASLLCIILQANQNDQHGGQSIPKFDYDMAPGVAKSMIKNVYKVMESKEYPKEMIEPVIKQCELYFKKHNRILDKIEDFVIPNVYELALKWTERDTYQAMEIIVHNLNTMSSRAGAQVPFSSINYGTDTSLEGRMVIKNILLAEEAGLGNGETPIFPIHIFKMKTGFNYLPTDPNYDLFKLACRVSAKRLYPNFLNEDPEYNAMFYKEGDPNTEVATMGCAYGRECITYLNKCNEQLQFSDICMSNFKDFWDAMCRIAKPKKYSDVCEYIDLSEREIHIYDSKKIQGMYTKVGKVIRNKRVKNWCTVTLITGQVLTVTTDHPLVVSKQELVMGGKVVVEKDKIKKERIQAKDIVKGNYLFNSNDDPVYVCEVKPIKPQNGSYYYSYDVETMSDTFDLSGIQSHNCRTRVMGNVYDENRQVTCGRGNLSFTSINLPRLGLKHKNDLDGFFKELDDTIELVFRQLLHRFKLQCNRRVYNFPFLMGQNVWLDSDKLEYNDKLDDVLKHGTLSVGFIGLAECLVALIGKHHGESEEAQELGLKIIKFMRDKVDKKAQETKLNFSVLATPAEGLAGRFVAIDKKYYGEIEGITDKEYYTNSFHVPVYCKISAHKKIELEAPYHELCNGGHITYVEVDGDPSSNVEGFMELVKWMHDCNIGYGSINHPVDRDPVCGYTGIINDVCPCCGRRDGEGIPVELYDKIRKEKHNAS